MPEEESTLEALPDNAPAPAPRAEEAPPASPRAEDLSAVDQLMDETMPESGKEPAKKDPPETDADLEPDSRPGELPTLDDEEGRTKPATEETKKKPELIENLDSVQLDPNSSPKQIANFDALRATAKHWQTVGKEAVEKIIPALKHQLEEASKVKGLTPEIEKELTDLRTFRALQSPTEDPAFVEKYDQPIAKAEGVFYDVLMRNGAKEDWLIKSIKEAGGPLKLDPNWVKTNILDNDKVGFLDKKKVEDAMLRMDALQTDRTEEMRNRVENRDKYLEDEKRQLDDQDRLEKETIESRVKEITDHLPWAQKQEYPADATVDQKKAVDEHNAQVTQIETIFRNALYPPDAKTRTDVAMAAAMSHKLSILVGVQENDIKKLTDEVTRLRKAGAPPKAPGNRPGAQSQKKTDTDFNTPMEEAIDKGLEAAGI